MIELSTKFIFEFEVLEILPTITILYFSGSISRSLKKARFDNEKKPMDKESKD